MKHHIAIIVKVDATEKRIVEEKVCSEDMINLL
jgi:hypothetical protein